MRNKNKDKQLEKNNPLVAPFYSIPYLIFVIFFTRAKVLENKIYTEKRKFCALNL